MYPAYNQLDPDNPNCEEESSHILQHQIVNMDGKNFLVKDFICHISRNYGLNVRIARFHNIFGPYGTWKGGKEKAPAAMCRKVAEAPNRSSYIEVWGDGKQTRSFLYIDECIEAVQRLMASKTFDGPVNIGSEEMVSINQLAQMAIDISGKDIWIKNIDGQEFEDKYGFKCPLGVRGRNSDNTLYREKIGWEVSQPLIIGMKKTYDWIDKQVNK